MQASSKAREREAGWWWQLPNEEPHGPFETMQAMAEDARESQAIKGYRDWKGTRGGDAEDVCHWCGEGGSNENPLALYVVSDDVRDTKRAHKTCAYKAAAAIGVRGAKEEGL